MSQLDTAGMASEPTPAISTPGDMQPMIARVRELAGQVPDPEIPVINLQELGILRDVQQDSDGLVVTLTPTYTGCPATEVIRQDVIDSLSAAGFCNVRVQVSLSPAWTTDWISDDGRRKLREYGIAPPAATRASAAASADGRAGLAPGGCGLGSTESVIRFITRSPASTESTGSAPACPRCESAETERISEHGSTPCKALYRCLACREPFDYFKPY